MTEYYLAVDIGASSGRHILAHMEEGKISLKEIYRFANGMKKKNGHLCWDLSILFAEILAGLRVCKALGKIPKSMAVDTWAVDYVLLDSEGKIIGNTYGYRDSRMEGMDDKVYEIIFQKDLYARTGIQKQMFNTIYQLMAVKQQEPENMEKAESLLLVPDYFNFLLTGNKKTEYTNVSTTQLVSPDTKDWDMELIYSFAELCEMAEECDEFPSRVDVNDKVFFAPDSMIKAIQNYCRESGQKVPESVGEISTVIYQSLAESYGKTVKEIESITGKTYDSINVVGGGANADYLNQLTAKSIGKTVYSGPTEATAIGNLTVQMLKAGVFSNLEEARSTIFDSFEIKCFGN